MNKKKVTGIIAVAAIVVIILIAAGSKKQSPAPEELTGEDRIHHAYLLESRQEYAITYHDKPYVLNKVKLAKRDPKGVKPRI